MKRGALLPLLLCAAPAAAQVIDQSTAEHYVWGGSNDGWHYVKRDDLSVIRMRMAPGAIEERHLHRRARLFIQVLTGTMTIDIAGKVSTLTPGQMIEVPPATAHHVTNGTKAPIEFLVISNPPAPGDREVVK